MNFDLSEEQLAFDHSLRRMVSEKYTLALRREHQKSDKGYSEDVWEQLANLGVLGLTIAQERGGYGGSSVDAMFVMNALGPALLLEPLVPTCIVSASLVEALGSEQQQSEMLPAIAQGRLTMTLAHAEPESRYELSRVATSAERTSRGWKLNGAKSVVPHATQAGQLIVSARISGTVDAAEGIALFLVDPAAAGLSIRDYTTMDGTRAGEIRLENVEVTASHQLGGDAEIVEHIELACDKGATACCAEAVGIMDALHALTVDYVKQRKQFGTTIGSFQAVQHRLVDMVVMMEQARSLTYLAAIRTAGTDAAARRVAVSAAKVMGAKAGKFVAQQAIQLHGGIGVTDEYICGHMAKRLFTLAILFGDADSHLERFIQTQDAHPEQFA
ncbi:MAG: acyl-CoA dehydrogenase family protein [Polaromonas sp.]|uniref:acyl-CoA dehydrogenase family protein n=1 Tax=Polaromonas sp. TaxID=1869339 RepID=UPI0025F9CD21|nr:acyl-CoA dehydrogenase family protein [Polaromonas sp.]MBI2727741.1 acyl-CoA dehydrogenase family protein [Polaromonas sp.]